MENSTALFVKIIIAIIVIYGVVLIINFLKDKFINKEGDTKNADYLDLFTILSKLFLFGGVGFAVGNIFQVIFESGNRNHGMNIGGEWQHFFFGVVLVAIGFAFKSIKEELGKDKGQPKNE